MATPAADRVFIDTNVLVYSALQLSPLHGVATQYLADLRQAGAELWISRQILREYMATLTRPQATTLPSPITTVIADVAVFQAIFRIAEVGPAVMANLLNLLTAIPIGGKQIHDANIIATMQAYQIPRLLTYNTIDFARFAAAVTVIPLVP